MLVGEVRRTEHCGGSEVGQSMWQTLCGVCGDNVDCRYRQALAVSDNPAASFNIKLSLATLLPRIMPSAAVVTAELKRVHRDLVRLASEAEPITGLQTPTTIPS